MKFPIIALVVLLVLGVGYFAFMQENPTSLETQNSEAVPEKEQVDEQNTIEDVTDGDTAMDMPANDDTEITEMEVGETTETEAAAEIDTEAETDLSATSEIAEEPVTTTEPVSEVKEFTVDSFSFGYSVEEIRVNEGDTVTINLTNSAGVHDWVVDEFDAATEIIRAGETTSVTFVADAAGTYEFYCSVGNHRAQGMVGTLVVE